MESAVELENVRNEVLRKIGRNMLTMAVDSPVICAVPVTV